MHACACIRMVENDQKQSKAMKKVPFSSCRREAHKRLTKKNKEKQIKQFVGQRLEVTPNRWLTPKRWLLI